MQKKDAQDRYYINTPKNIISLKHKYSQYKNSLRIKAQIYIEKGGKGII